jgi:7,8-dihydropterin-6-yl-methyl-4-(beta-D-ribofuranosyl)aminobenzene 5'-phosphate synthase
MRLTVLTENVAGETFAAEYGLSYLIETGSGTVLFDTGHSNIFLQNAAKLDIDLGATDTVLLSHGHWDHGNGLKYLQGKRLICHPGVFINRYRKDRSGNIGLELSADQLRHRFDVITTEKPYRINKEITFLGEIPRANDFEAQQTAFAHENGEDDYVMDDSALAVVEGNKLIVVSGCSHAGICNIIDHAMCVTGLQHIEAVFGGFHLMDDDLQTEKTISYVRAHNIKRIYPSHCTKLPALAAFYSAFHIEQVKTGMVFVV